MDSNQLVLLLILFSPLIASVLVLIIGKAGDGAAKWSALIFSLVPLALTIYLWFAYQNPLYPANADGFKFVFSVPWLPQINSNFTIGVDGISMSMILLTAILTPLGIIISFKISDRLPLFMALLLGLTTGMFGVFMALDLVIFFIFWKLKGESQIEQSLGHLLLAACQKVGFFTKDKL
jgi:NADH-quinone oxidoreductase subunit M